MTGGIINRFNHDRSCRKMNSHHHHKKKQTFYHRRPPPPPPPSSMEGPPTSSRMNNRPPPHQQTYHGRTPHKNGNRGIHDHRFSNNDAWHRANGYHHNPVMHNRPGNQWHRAHLNDRPNPIRQQMTNNDARARHSNGRYTDAMKQEVERRVAEELRKKKQAEELKKKQQAEEKIKKQQQAAWNKMVDCTRGSSRLCRCDGKCIDAYLNSLSKEDQMAIKIARNPQTENEWIRRADAFHEKHKNGNAEKRVRAYEAANQKRRM